MSKKNLNKPDLKEEEALWQQGIAYVAGVDEVGVGCLAGPVYAAAVILPVGAQMVGLDDSKKLTPAKRQALVPRIIDIALAYAVASCSAAQIDEINILQAARFAMSMALSQLLPKALHVLVDGRYNPLINIPQTPLIKGDTRSQSIAAASILAKESRDAHMQELSVLYPGYGFEKHRGYGTAMHLAALQKLGPCPIHRRTFAPVVAAGPITFV